MARRSQGRPTASAPAEWIAELRAVAGDAGAAGAMAAAVAAMSGPSGPSGASTPAIDGCRLFEWAEPDARAVDRLRPHLADAPPDLLGVGYEALIAGDVRRSTGAHYTPRPLTEHLVSLVLAERLGAEAVTVCDPSAGGGAFLLAAARALRSRGAAVEWIVRSALWGADIDPTAVAVAEASLTLWAAGEGVSASPGPNLAVGDFLRCGPDVWGGREADAPLELDAVVGNPPFQGQLQRATSRSRAEAALLAGRFGEVVGTYTDTAALFLVAACQVVRPGGRIALVQPLSFLASRDASRVRRELAERAALVGLWVSREPVFEAAVSVCAPVLEVDGPRRSTIVRSRGRSGASFDSVDHDNDQLVAAPSWAGLALAPLGVPAVELPAGGGVLGDLATATAGFRDEYYGLVAHVREAPEGAGEAPGPGGEPAGAGGDSPGLFPLVTAGLIDPVHLRWGHATTRFAGERRQRPVLHLDSLAHDDARLARWVSDRLSPKLLVATQTPVLEAVVDAAGRLVPSVPVVAVQPGPDDLWRVAAAVLAPPVSAWALALSAGAALSVDAIKLSAKQLLKIPLPADGPRWEAAAAVLRDAADAAGAGDSATWAACLKRFGVLATEAYGLDSDHPVLAWWSDRVPGWR